jgi:AraC family transcriptional regulator
MLETKSSIHGSPHSRTDTALSHHRAVERVITAMHQRLDEDFSLEEMAHVAYMSPFHFNRIFRQLTGVPPCQFMSALRLESARRLLLTTKLSVTEVCLEVGYSSLGTFVRRFTDLTGLSPRGLRRLARSPVLLEPAPEPCPLHSGVSGRVAGPADFKGLIFVGLFNSPIPKGRPAGCAVLGAPGPFLIASAPDGSYHLLAAGFREGTGCLRPETALRGGGQTVRLRDGRAEGSNDLELRPAMPTDPPILMTFPALRRAVAGIALKMATRDKKRSIEAG